MSKNKPINADLFVTCIVDQLYPQVGASVVRVLRRLGVTVGFPEDQTCCGQAVYNSGFTQEARTLALRVLHSFRNSDYIIVPSGSCGAMMRVFYQDLFADEPTLLAQAKTLAGKVYEFSEFLVKVLGIEDTGAVYQGSAVFHPGCHLLREMEVRDEPQKILGSVSGLVQQELEGAEICCGFGGSFSVKLPHISEGMLADKVTNIKASGADTLVSCDMSCLMHIGGALHRNEPSIKIRHLAQILDSESEGP